MSNLLDFPTLDTGTAVAATQPAELNVGQYLTLGIQAHEPAIRALVAKYAEASIDVSTPAGFAAAKAARHDLRENGRFKLQRLETAIVKALNEGKRTVGEQIAKLVVQVQPAEDRFHNAITSEEERREREKQEAIRKDEERREALRQRVRQIMGYINLAADLTPDRIAQGVIRLEAMNFGPEWQEYQQEASQARDDTVIALRKLQLQKEEAARLAAENERLRAEAAAVHTSPSGIKVDAASGEIIEPEGYTEGPGSQQVLKAEAARPDATDRETPDTASPGVGPMGAGQPADAGPTTDQRSDSGGSRAAPVTAPPGPVCRGDRQDEPEATDAMESGLEDAAQDAGVAPGSLHQSAAQQGTNPVRRVGPAASTPAALPLAEQPREVDEHFARTLREAMAQGDQLHPADLAATRRAVHAPPEAAQPLAFRAARFSDGSLATERDGVVVEVYSAAETDAIQKLLGVRT